MILRSLPLLALLLLAACRQEPAAPPELPWERVDLWQIRPKVEATPIDNKWLRVSIQRIAFLGAEEVRDMSLVPAQQLVAFPRRTAGQIRALEQVAGSRLVWRVKTGQDAYFSFIPLGAERPCPCRYRVEVREGPGRVKGTQIYPVAPMGPIAPETVEVDLSGFAGREVEIVLQLDAPPKALVHGPGRPLPSALWGSPAVYRRGTVPAASPEGKPERPNILLIGIDTLRADHVGAWGRKPSPTPAMDRLAAQSDVWLDAYSVFNITNPSFASILTGLYGKNHGVYDLRTPLPKSHTTLAEHLKVAGYETLGLIAAAHLGDHNSGLGQGFDEVTRSTEHFAGEIAVDMTMDWLSNREVRNVRGNQRPFFAWVHLFDPHTPHTPPEPYSLGFRPEVPAGLGPVRKWTPFRQTGPRYFDEPVLGGHRDLYTGEVAYLDRQVGRLLGFLESRGLLENTVVALVADHGEGLGEHGVRYRHVGLHDTTTHVPLMIRWPGRERTGRRIRGLVETVDLFPTLLEAAGLEVPPQDGKDLGELTAEGRRGRRAVFAEHAGRLGLMVRTPEHKYILSQGNTKFFADGAYLYDLKADPGETRNLAGQGLPAEAQLSDLLRRWLADRRNRPQTRAREQNEEERARLRALGYL